MTPKTKAAIEEAARSLSETHGGKAIDLDKFLLVKKIIQEVIEHPERYGLMPIPTPTVLPKESDHPEYGKHGMCKRCNRTQAVMDYNGHGYWVCNSCDDALGREFDEEYK